MIVLMEKSKVLQIAAWTIAAATSGLSVLVWANERFPGKLTAYSFFPLLGLIAYGLMWGHYIVGALRRLMGQDLSVLRHYFRWTSWIVLIMILLHPGLLYFNLWRDGFGLPPGSALEVYDSLRGALLSGSLGLTIFLAYEVKRWISSKPWKSVINYLQNIAMVLIFIHGLGLGRELEVGWFRLVWFFYGASLLLATIFNIYQDKKRSSK